MSDDRFGWARRDGCVGLTQAVKALRDAARRAPVDDDRPPPSTFPMTPAARQALDYAHADRRGLLRRHRVVNEAGQIVRKRP